MAERRSGRVGWQSGWGPRFGGGKAVAEDDGAAVFELKLEEEEEEEEESSRGASGVSVSGSSGVRRERGC